MDLIHNITLFKKSLGLIFSFKARRSGLIPKVEVLLGLYYPNAQSASHHLLLLVPPVLFVNDSSSHSGWALVVVVSCQLLINQSQCLVHEYVLFKQKKHNLLFRKRSHALDVSFQWKNPVWALPSKKQKREPATTLRRRVGTREKSLPHTWTNLRTNVWLTSRRIKTKTSQPLKSSARRSCRRCSGGLRNRRGLATRRPVELAWRTLKRTWATCTPSTKRGRLARQENLSGRRPKTLR